jgi:phospholipid/cholesterol/gamma-HCH transport system substrate-binding protein
MSKLRGRQLGRVIPGLIVAVLVLSACALVFGGPSVHRLTAHFGQAVGIYPGSDVRVLGVKVGTIESVRPQGRTVEVVMTYESKYRIPADASAVIVPPSVVSDRYVQLSPVYTGGPVLADDANLGIDRTTTPVELDQIYKSLNDLNTALGPEGANRDGALSRLLAVGRLNLQDQGGKINTTVTNVSKAVQTLSDGRQDLFGTITNLQQFTTALAQSDVQVREFNSQLADVSDQLDGERTELGAALRSLSLALAQVASFVRQNRDELVSNVEGLTKITAILVKQKDALAQVLEQAPLALSNLNLAYNPSAGTLDTRDDALSGSDPAMAACALLAITKKLPLDLNLQQQCGQLANTASQCGAAVPAPLRSLLGQVPPVFPLPCVKGSAPGGSVAGGLSQNPLNPAPVPPNPGGGAGQLDPTLGGILKAGGR